MVGSNASISRQRLDSWKEIAAFFGRDERTVNRWEKDLGLPVHRLPGAKGRVYAYTDELSTWLATSRNGAASPEAAVANLKVITGQTSPAVLVSPSAPLELVPTSSVPRNGGHNEPGRTKRSWLVAAAVISMAALAVMLFRHPSASPDSYTDRQSRAATNPQ